MPWFGFEPTILAFERAKTVRALDRVATVIGDMSEYPGQLKDQCWFIWNEYSQEL
jgi:hypothetical protein